MKKIIILILLFTLLVIVLLHLFPNTQKKILSNYDIRFSNFYNSKGDEDEFSNLIDKLEDSSGLFSLYIKDITHNEIYNYNENLPMYAASLYKIPIAVAVFKSVQSNIVQLNESYPYLPIDFSTGTGSINQYPYGTRFTLNQLVEKLLKESDNTAQNIITRIIPQDVIKNSFDLTNETGYYYNINVATSKQITDYLAQILDSSFIDSQYKEALFNMMSQTEFDDRINSGLNKDLQYAHKIGNWDASGSWHDCGIVFGPKSKVIVCLMTENTTYNEFLEISKQVGQFISYIMR